MICPETSDTCVVTNKTNDDLTRIITTRECLIDNKILLSEKSEEPNTYNASVNTFLKSHIGKLSAAAAQKVAGNIIKIQEDMNSDIENKLSKTGLL